MVISMQTTIAATWTEVSDDIDDDGDDDDEGRNDEGKHQEENLSR
jgi:hypothetical protein